MRRPFAAHGATSRLAEIVVDANSGRVLYAQNENELRHPASITKVMTLYLLFKELDKGRLHLSSRLTISRHAAAQAPTKLGLRPGQTIAVDDAIKAIVTKSANDIAVAIAENIGGNEENFCAMMTREAHALGMMHTHYADASGLPNNAQITTAADLAILGRAIQERFPRYFHYFSLEEFAYHGQIIRNHNHLLGRIPGLDGIKTGYTRRLWLQSPDLGALPRPRHCRRRARRRDRGEPRPCDGRAYRPRDGRSFDPPQRADYRGSRRRTRRPPSGRGAGA